ncbi:arginine--tRNA ligase, partial [Bacillus wiedmannii]
MDYNTHFAKSLSSILKDELTQNQILDLIETPKQDEFGDAAFPCFSLAKQYKKSPAIFAKEVAEKLSNPFFTKVEAVGPYVNVFFNREIVSDAV